MTEQKQFTIRLLSHDISVTVNSPSLWANDAMGRSCLQDQAIFLNESMPNDVLNSTLIHELVHMICDLNSLDLSENYIDAIAIGIFTLIKDNPELMADIFFQGEKRL